MSLDLRKTPFQQGLRMPAEWEPHAATWMSWPFDDDMWHGQLQQVRDEYTQLVQAIARREAVHLLVCDKEAERSAQAALAATPGVHFHPCPLDDVWMRDNGPIFVRGDRPGAMAMVDWQFNAWGGKYSWSNDNAVPAQVEAQLHLPRFTADIIMEGGALDGNGAGLCLTTEQCLLTPTRNPHLNKAGIEAYLRDYLGVQQVVWLRQGLEGDHTDGHVDTISRFIAEDTVVTSVCLDAADSNYAPMQENRELLGQVRLAGGRRLQVIDLPLPKEHLLLAGGLRLPATYANFYLINGAVLVPQYGDAHDLPALKILQEALPRHEVIGLPSRYIITGGGSFHCLTQQQPKVP